MTASKITAMVNAIKAVLETDFPVYSGDFANESDREGYVQIAGIDLDVELGGVSMDSTISNALVSLITQLKANIPGKLVTMAAFSVGADPDGACTVAGSSHCGESRLVMQGAGQLLDIVNVMAYDAGPDFANNKYQEAMGNYFDLIGNKAVLGLSNQTQWPGLMETTEQLVAKGTWAFQQDLGGTFLWEIGGAGNPKSLLEQLTLAKDINS